MRPTYPDASTTTDPVLASAAWLCPHPPQGATVLSSCTHSTAVKSSNVLSFSLPYKLLPSHTHAHLLCQPPASWMSFLLFQASSASSPCFQAPPFHTPPNLCSSPAGFPPSDSSSSELFPSAANSSAPFPSSRRSLLSLPSSLCLLLSP